MIKKNCFGNLLSRRPFPHRHLSLTGAAVFVLAFKKKPTAGARAESDIA